ncbi:MAG: virginiamycin B lyase family protein, partial [Gemmatimonadales bacterium]
MRSLLLMMALSLPLPALVAGQGPPSSTIVEYVLPRPGNFPHDPAVAPDGTIWYTDQRNSYIGHLDPETGKVVDYPTPTSASGPHGLTVAPDGAIWYTGQA